MYELPYFIKQKLSYNLEVEDCIKKMHQINTSGTYQERTVLRNEIETAYLEKEISRMYDRLAKTGRDTGNVSEKLTKLKKRRKELE